ncbi:MAG TPA: MEDS domain-containing protein [Candidatus Rubrimentiphilum sp.]|nr:MEDS domain-containing protein [Candidatus Rubrimentiphilum sp.]
MTPEPRGHFVQFCGADERYLIGNVGRFLFEGLRAGEGLVVIATPQRSDALAGEIARLGGDAEAALADGRFRVYDRDEILAQICVAGQPNQARFETVVGGTLANVPTERVRAYGEMVGKLWSDNRRAEAILLEQMWGDLQTKLSFSLFCSYSIDVFGDDFELTRIDPVLCTHTHLVPGGLDRALDKALNCAMDEVLGERVESLRSLMKANYRPGWGIVPRPESMILWLRNNLPDLADAIIGRARGHYEKISQEPAWDPA